MSTSGSGNSSPSVKKESDDLEEMEVDSHQSGIATLASAQLSGNYINLSSYTIFLAAESEEIGIVYCW